MNKLTHLKRFNESEENLNISDVRSSKKTIGQISDEIEELEDIKNRYERRGVLWLGVCYFALQTFQVLDKFNRQNNSTKPLLVAGAVN
jgi:hypothetical protein